MKKIIYSVNFSGLGSSNTNFDVLKDKNVCKFYNGFNDLQKAKDMFRFIATGVSYDHTLLVLDKCVLFGSKIMKQEPLIVFTMEDENKDFEKLCKEVDVLLDGVKS